MYAIREAWEETILMLNGKFQAIIFFFLVLAFIFFFPSFFGVKPLCSEAWGMAEDVNVIAVLDKTDL